MSDQDKAKVVTEEQAARVGEAFRSAGSAVGEAFKQFGASLGASLSTLGATLDDATEKVKAAKTTAKAEDAPAPESEPGA